MEPIPKLSVILATYNRAETLRTTLDYLAQQSLAGDLFEVIVVDDGSPDATKAVVDEARDHFPAEITYLRHENRGPGYSQNRGIRQARAPLLLFMADDIWMTAGALKAHLDFHQAHPEPHVAALGKVLQSPELFTQSVFLQHWDPFKFRDIDVPELHYSLFWACNLSVKKSFLVENEMFREARGRGGAPAHEDTELGYRLTKYGLRLLYNEPALGYHYHPYTLDQAINRYYERGLNWDEFKKFVPDPEMSVAWHDLRLSTLVDHFRVLRGPNSLRGAERSLTWHIIRHGIRMLTFNRLTLPCFWKPVLQRAETSPALAKLMNRQLYRAFLYSYFVRGVHEAPKRYDN